MTHRLPAYHQEAKLHKMPTRYSSQDTQAFNKTVYFIVCVLVVDCDIFESKRHTDKACVLRTLIKSYNPLARLWSVPQRLL